MRFLTLTVMACLASVAVAPPPSPGSPQNPATIPSFNPEQAELFLTAWKATGGPAARVPPLPAPVGQGSTSEPSTPSAWAPVKPADAVAALAALAPVAAPVKKRTPALRRALRQAEPPRDLADPTTPQAAKAAASIVAAVDGASGAAPSLVEVPSRGEAASAVGGGDATGGAMEAAADDARAAAVAAAAADPTVPLEPADASVPPTGPIPAALTDRLKAQDADEPAPLGPGVSVFLEEKQATAPPPGGAPVVEPVGASPPPPHTSPNGVVVANAGAAARDSVDSAALPGARAFAATKGVPLAASTAPSGLGPVFAASLPAALPAAHAHGDAPAGRAAAVGGTDVCVVPGGKLLILTADAVSVRDATNGALLAGPTPLSALFQDASGGVYTSPRCVFDGAADLPGGRRTYLAALRAPAVGGRAGADSAEPAARLVVAATTDGADGDPMGAWNVFTVAVDGIDRRSAPGGSKLPGAAACPTLGCSARGLALGVDAHGLWATTDLWTPVTDSGDAVPSSLVGPLAVGLSKRGMKGGAPARPAALVLSGFPAWAAHGGLAPSVTEAWAAHDTRAGGTVYFAGLGSGRVGVWGVHGTAALRDGLAVSASDLPAGRPALPFIAPAPFFIDHTRATEDAPPALSAGIQRPSSLALVDTTAAPTAPLDPAAPRRLGRAAFADGMLWLATASPVFAGGLTPTMGTAYFGIRPVVGDRGLRSGSTTVEQTGWVAVDGAATLAPSIAVARDGAVVVAFALASPAFEPGFAYATVSGRGSSAVKLVAAGQPSAGLTPAVALKRATRAEPSAGDVAAFSVASGAPPPAPPLPTAHTPDIAAGSGHVGALDSIAVGLYSGAVADPAGDAFWVGGRRAACGGAPGECEPAWATALGRVEVGAEMI